VEEVVFRGYLMAASLHLERRLSRKVGVGHLSWSGASFHVYPRSADRHYGYSTQLYYDDRHCIRLHPTAAPVDLAAVLANGSYNLGPILELLDRYFALTFHGLDARKLRDSLSPARTATGSGPTSVPREREIPRTLSSFYPDKMCVSQESMWIWRSKSYSLISTCWRTPGRSSRNLRSAATDASGESENNSPH
jgi:hypothetical protein